MKLEIFLEAEHGEDGGSLNEVLVTTDVRLTVDNLPRMEDAERSMRQITTESWAYINWKDEYDYDRGDGDDEGPKGFGVVFADTYGSDSDARYASFYALDQALREVVESGEYLEKIRHFPETTSAEFVYELDPGLFKKLS